MGQYSCRGQLTTNGAEWGKFGRFAGYLTSQATSGILVIPACMYVGTLLQLKKNYEAPLQSGHLGLIPTCFSNLAKQALL